MGKGWEKLGGAANTVKASSDESTVDQEAERSVVPKATLLMEVRVPLGMKPPWLRAWLSWVPALGPWELNLELKPR